MSSASWFILQCELILSIYTSCRISLRWFRELPTRTRWDSCWKPAISNLFCRVPKYGPSFDTSTVSAFIILLLQKLQKLASDLVFFSFHMLPVFPSPHSSQFTQCHRLHQIPGALRIILSTHVPSRVRIIPTLLLCWHRRSDRSYLTQISHQHAEPCYVSDFQRFHQKRLIWMCWKQRDRSIVSFQNTLLSHASLHTCALRLLKARVSAWISQFKRFLHSHAVVKFVTMETNEMTSSCDTTDDFLNQNHQYGHFSNGIIALDYNFISIYIYIIHIYIFHSMFAWKSWALLCYLISD